MIDFSKIVFPCEGEYKVEPGWESCLILGLISEGSSVQALKTLANYWLIIDNEGTVKKIQNLKHVRFDRYRVLS